MKTRTSRSRRSRSFRRPRPSGSPRPGMLVGAPRAASLPPLGLAVVNLGDRQFAWTRDTPVDPAERRWLEEACSLALACSLWIDGPDAVDSQVLDIAVVTRAAEQLWSAMPGAPSWKLLDVDALVATFDCVLPPGSRDNAMASLITFIHWMRAGQHLSAEDSLTLLARCEPYIPELFRATGYQVAPLPAALRPC